MALRRRLWFGWFALAFFACDEPADASPPEPPSESRRCGPLLPGIEGPHETAEYWIERARTFSDPDDVLLRPAAIHVHNKRVAHLHGGFLSPASLGPPDALLADRLDSMAEGIASGGLVEASGARLPRRVLSRARVLDSLRLQESHHVALEAVPVRCAPIPFPLFRTPVDERFDRNLCSTLRPQELVQVLGQVSGGMLYVRTARVAGFITTDAPLSPSLSPEETSAFQNGPYRFTTRSSDDGEGAPFVFLPERNGEIIAATPEGAASIEFEGMSTRRDLTRRSFLETAFSLLGQPYGWAGKDGYDCSRLVLTVGETFGLRLPRNSRQQARAGTEEQSVSRDLSDEARIEAFDAALRRGIVLLEFPGHIMVYLGRSEEGTPMVLHAIAEYVEACEGEEHLREIYRVVVSDLSLGEESHRGSLLQRVEHVAVLGP
ncbi:MAG: NlpC/P60 family protein [Myxococcota bacterium]